VEGEDIDRVARPFHRLAVGAELESRKLGKGAARAVVRRQPLRVQEGHRAGLDRHRHAHAENLLRQIGGVDLQHDGAGVGLVDRGRYGGLDWEGQREREGDAGSRLGGERERGVSGHLVEGRGNKTGRV
jgi:hypothetical protein